VIIALAGGVGGAKLANGLAQLCDPADLLIANNIGDDFSHLGLHISPDLDSVMYRLAGLNDTERGWGLANESWRFMEALQRLGGPDWFNLGDQDLATHIERTRLLNSGVALSEATTHLSRALGIRHHIAPVSDDPVRTIVKTAGDDLPFQDYFVRLQCAPSVSGFAFEGADQAELLPDLRDALSDSRLAAIVICPSNPYVSIEPMLAIPALRRILENRSVPCVAVSPIIGGDTVKGPAAKMMRELGAAPSSTAVAAYYEGLIDGLVIDAVDEKEATKIKAMGVAPFVTTTLMKSDADERALADAVLSFAAGLRK